MSRKQNRRARNQRLKKAQDRVAVQRINPHGTDDNPGELDSRETSEEGDPHAESPAAAEQKDYPADLSEEDEFSGPNDGDSLPNKHFEAELTDGDPAEKTEEDFDLPEGVYHEDQPAQKEVTWSTKDLAEMQAYLADMQDFVADEDAEEEEEEALELDDMADQLDELADELDEESDESMEEADEMAEDMGEEEEAAGMGYMELEDEMDMGMEEDDMDMEDDMGDFEQDMMDMEDAEGMEMDPALMDEEDPMDDTPFDGMDDLDMGMEEELEEDAAGMGVECADTDEDVISQPLMSLEEVTQAENDGTFDINDVDMVPVQAGVKDPRWFFVYKGNPVAYIALSDQENHEAFKDEFIHAEYAKGVIDLANHAGVASALKTVNARYYAAEVEKAAAYKEIHASVKNKVEADVKLRQAESYDGIFNLINVVLEGSAKNFGVKNTIKIAMYDALKKAGVHSTAIPGIVEPVFEKHSVDFFGKVLARAKELQGYTAQSIAEIREHQASIPSYSENAGIYESTAGGQELTVASYEESAQPQTNVKPQKRVPLSTQSNTLIREGSADFDRVEFKERMKANFRARRQGRV